MLHQYRVACGRAIALASVIAFGQSTARAGDLNPPAGPVRATMAPLDAIEPRVCVNDLPGSANSVHVISSPGNYFLRADVSGQVGLHGIEIDYSVMPPGSQVSIDLGGFSLLGVAGSGDAIHALGTPSGGEMLRLGNHPNVISFIGRWGGDGMHVEDVEDVCFSGVRVKDCVGDGAEVRSSGGGENQMCGHTSHFIANGSGIVLALSAGASTIVELDDIVSSGNSGIGVDISWIDSTVGPVDNGTSSIALRNVNASTNGGDGVRVRVDRRHSVDMRADELMASNNTGRGVRLEGDRSASRDMSVDMDDMMASGNGGDGFSLRDIVARLVRCVTRRNGGDGGVGDRADVELVACSSSENGGNGHTQSGGAIAIEGGAFRGNGTGAVGGGGLVINGDGRGNVNELLLQYNIGPGVHVMDHTGSLHLRGVVSSSNAGDGVVVDSSQGQASGRVFLDRCIADANGGDGFALVSTTGGMIRDCVATGNSANGYAVSGVGHVLVWNTATDNGIAGYTVSLPGNSMGPQVDEFGMPGLTNPAANFVR